MQIYEVNLLDHIIYHLLMTDILHHHVEKILCVGLTQKVRVLPRQQSFEVRKLLLYLDLFGVFVHFVYILKGKNYFLV